LKSTPLILGHRGASAEAPENTLAAFARAIEAGADGIEFDVRLSRDHVPVVIHDESLKRTGRRDVAVASMDATELMKEDVGSWFQVSRFDSQCVPSLQQVFDLFQRHDGILYLEMKCTRAEATALANEVVKLVRKNKMRDRVVVECFDLLAIEAVKQFDSTIRTAALFEPKLTKPISTLRKAGMIEHAKSHHADEIAFHHTLASPSVVAKALEAGFEIVLWTVDNPTWIARARSMGIKALISNDPAKMVQHRAELS
jgi:glycerophosphoryl diester phosphodiesterase